MCCTAPSYVWWYKNYGWVNLTQSQMTHYHRWNIVIILYCVLTAWVFYDIKTYFFSIFINRKDFKCDFHGCIKKKFVTQSTYDYFKKHSSVIACYIKVILLLY